MSYDLLFTSLEATMLARRWDAVRDTWADFIPAGPLGSSPEQTLAAFVEEQEFFLNELPLRGELTAVEIPRGEIPSLIFREAMFWLYKSLHVLGAAEVHIDAGLPTWSVSSSYQSGYFATRAVMAFFGIAVTEYQRLSLVFDICRDMGGMRPQRLSEIGAFAEQIPCRSLGKLFDHADVWRLFQRLLRVVTRAPWPKGLSEYFPNLDLATFARQRHGLHYQLPFWIEEDLHEFTSPESFRNVHSTGTGRMLFDSEQTNFTSSYACALTTMALALFRDLSRATRRLDGELEVMNQHTGNERHPLFADMLAVPVT